MSQRDSALVIFRRGDCLKEKRTRANEGNQTCIAVRGNRPKQIDPLVKTFRQLTQNFAAGNQEMESRRAATLEKTCGTAHQFQCRICTERFNRVRQRSPGVGRNAASASGERFS